MHDLQLPERFTLLKRLGAGGGGVVYEVFDRERQASVALKTLRRLDPMGLFRFKREFRALVDVKHPNLVRLGELFSERGQWFFTMELVQGVDLVRYVRRHAGLEEPTMKQPLAGVQRAAPARTAFTRPSAAFDEGRLREAFGQLAEAIAVLHGNGMVHRDIKPSNVLVTESGRVVLLDFGLITESLASHETGDHAVGTLAYMAPEQLERQEVDARADWYAFGVALYEALTGEVPFGGSVMQVLAHKVADRPERPSVLFEGIPRDLDHLCVGLLRSRPSDRLSGAAVLEAFARPRPAAREAPREADRPAFVGRKLELGRLTDAFEETRNGRGQTVLVRGESGVGKTVLVREFLSRLKARGSETLVFDGRCYERESVPYKAFDSVIDAICVHLRQLPATQQRAFLSEGSALLGRLFPVLQRLIPLRQPAAGDEMSPQEQRSRAFAAMRRMLVALAEDRPLILFIDDFQWADPDSHALLSEILRPGRLPRVLILLTTRVAGIEAEEPLGSKGVAEVVTIALEGLSPPEVKELVSPLAGPGAPLDEGWFASIASETGGHPLFAQELARHLLTGSPDAQGTVDLDDAIWRRAARLDSHTRALLEVIAVAGVPLPLVVLGRVASLTPPQFSKALDVLMEQTLVEAAPGHTDGAVAPYHDRIREAVASRMDPEVRKRTHRGLADALDQAGMAREQPQLLIHHLEAAGELGWAADQALAAAQRATLALAFDRAVEMYRTALRLGQFAPEALARIEVQLAEALVNAGRGAEAAAMYLKAAQADSPAMRLDYQRRAAEQLLISGRVDQGLRVLSQVLASIGERLHRTPRLALLSLLWQRTKLRLRGLRWRRRHVDDLSPRLLTRLEVYRTAGLALAMVDTIRGADYHARALMVAFNSGDPRRIAHFLLLESSYVASQGRRSRRRADTLVEALRQIAEGMPDDAYLRALVASAEALQHYFSGQFRRGADRFREGEDLFRTRTTGTTWEVNTSRIFRLLSLRYAGAYLEMRASHQEAMADAVRRGDRYAEGTLNRACAILWLLEDQPDRALEQLVATPWVPDHQGFHVQHWQELWTRAEVLLYQGRGSQALRDLGPQFVRLEESLLTRSQVIRSQEAWLRGRMAVACLETQGASPVPIALVRRLARKLERQKVPFAILWACLLRAALSRQEGRLPECLDRLQDCATSARELGQLSVAAAAQRRRGELLGGAEGEALVRAADEWFVAEGVRSPERLTQMLAPGFRRAPTIGNGGSSI